LGHEGVRLTSSEPLLRVGDQVSDALRQGGAVVALESAVLTHGLPAPENLLALDAMEDEVRAGGAIPATCLVHRGSLWVGAARSVVEEVVADPAREKAAARDLGRVLSEGSSAGLTVSASLFAAKRAGIRVFATGGIGGVHLGAAESGDVSADLLQLSRAPLVTVCSGAKSVLDIGRTLEYLETMGVPVLAFGSYKFPGFYEEDSGFSVPQVNSAAEIAAIAQAQWELEYRAGVVVGNPVPRDSAVAREDWQSWLEAAVASASQNGIQGKEVTPYLLSRVAALSDGRTLRANLALLASNARLAGEVAVQLFR
jgi:pseudouridine-5'-phosphate glycosidase